MITIGKCSLFAFRGYISKRKKNVESAESFIELFTGWFFKIKKSTCERAQFYYSI